MNWQNIPRHDKTVKRAVLPKLGALSFFDYSQIEPRLTAYYAEKIGHPEFANQIRAGVDSYTAVAKLITGKDVVSDEERQVWKVAYLSLMYGGGVNTLQEQFGGTKKAAREMRDTFHDNWPAVGALQDMVLRVHAKKGHITSLHGRHLHMEQYGEHKLLNKLIQGSAADIMKAAIVRVHRYLKVTEGWVEPLQSHMVSVVHDELIFDGPAREVAQLHSVIPDLMVDATVNETIPVLVDHEVSSTSWADKVDYDEWLATLKEAA